MNDQVIEKNPQPDDHDVDGPKLTFEHVASVQDVKFKAAWTSTLQAAWDKAYKKLDEVKRADDRLQTDDGADMMPFLGKTIRQLFDDKHTKSHKFQIVGATGGALK